MLQASRPKCPSLHELLKVDRLPGSDKDQPSIVLNGCFRPKAEIHDRPLPEEGLTPTRIIPRDTWPYRHNSLMACYTDKNCKSSFYMDRPKHCSGDTSRHPNSLAAAPDRRGATGDCAAAGSLECAPHEWVSAEAPKEKYGDCVLDTTPVS